MGKTFQDRVKDWLTGEPIRTKLLDYADSRGITGDTYDRNLSEEERELFKLTEAYGRVLTRKAMKVLGERYEDYSLESYVDGRFTSGGTFNDLETKVRYYELNSNTREWAWVVEAPKYEEMMKNGAWLINVFPNPDDFTNAWFYLWEVPETPPVDVVITSGKSVAKKHTGTKTKNDKGWFLKDAVISGYTE